MFWSRIIVAGTAMVVSGSITPVFAALWTEMYIPYNLDNNSDIDSDSFGDFGRYDLNDPLRQHLHLLSTPSNEPTPVYFYAHANGGKADQLTPIDLDIFVDAGYSVISWESVSHLDTPEDVEVCWSDFELVWSWFQENAETYGLDSDHAVIGGRSRGTVCSWLTAHSAKPGIQGIYMYNALPNSVWGEGEGESVWLDAITAESPPAHLVYGPECPKPITQDCDPNDGHNPKNGQKIVDRYAGLGISSRIQLTDGLTNSGIGIYDLFPTFIGLPLSTPSLSATCSTKLSELCPAASTASTRECGRCARTNEGALFDAGCTVEMVTEMCTSADNNNAANPPFSSSSSSPFTSTCTDEFSKLCLPTISPEACGECAETYRRKLYFAGCTVRTVTELCISEWPELDDAPTLQIFWPSFPPSGSLLPPDNEDGSQRISADPLPAGSGCDLALSHFSAYLYLAVLAGYVAFLVQ